MTTEPFLLRAVANTARAYGRVPAVGATGAMRIAVDRGYPMRIPERGAGGD